MFVLPEGWAYRIAPQAEASCRRDPVHHGLRSGWRGLRAAPRRPARIQRRLTARSAATLTTASSAAGSKGNDLPRRAPSTVVHPEARMFERRHDALGRGACRQFVATA
jgi:hypothetical protein